MNTRNFLLVKNKFRSEKKRINGNNNEEINF